MLFTDSFNIQFPFYCCTPAYFMGFLIVVDFVNGINVSIVFSKRLLADN